MVFCNYKWFACNMKIFGNIYFIYIYYFYGFSNYKWFASIMKTFGNIFYLYVSHQHF